MKTIHFVLALLLAFTASAATSTRNDDSCDIAVLPAATLLLPYFEVDLDDGSQTTLLSTTNVTNSEAVARVTLWTDRGYPVFSFSVYLTGYDAQSLNLYDILGRGLIARDAAPRGEYSDANPAIGHCDVVPRITEEALARIQSAFTAAAMRLSVADSWRLPFPSNGATTGWMYMNLDHDDIASGYEASWASQNWVIVSMRSGPYSVDFDAAALGNGCSAKAPFTEATAGTAAIGPRP